MKLYSIYYTACLCPNIDSEWQPEIVPVNGRFDTEEKAREAAEKELRRHDWVDGAGGTYNFFKIKVESNFEEVEAYTKTELLTWFESMKKEYQNYAAEKNSFSIAKYHMFEGFDDERLENFFAE